MGSEFPEPIITEETFRVRGETIELTVAEAYDYIESVADSSEF